MAVIPWPDTPDSWLTDYIVWRINSGKAGDRPASVPAQVEPYADQVLYWCIWRRKGRPSPRPLSFPVTIPTWGYETLDAVNKRAAIQIPGTTVAPHAWMQTWTIERFMGTSEANMPPIVPEDVSVVAPYCWSVLNFMAWQRKRFSKPTTPRPKNVPLVIPKWVWDMLVVVNRAVPLGPPPPPPPPPGPPKPANTWDLPFPMMTTAWGPLGDSQYRDNNEAWERMRLAGVGAVGLQIAGGQPLFNPDAPGRIRAQGRKVFLWGVADPRDDEIIALTRADGYMPQVETPDEYNAAIRNFEAGYGTGISRSVYTTLYGFNHYVHRTPTDLSPPEGELTTSEYERMRPHCTHAMVECYIQDGGAHFPIINMIFATIQHGFDYYNPVIGLWRETPIAAYRPPQDPNTLDSFGRQIGVYLSEGMTPGNWVELGAIGT